MVDFDFEVGYGKLLMKSWDYISPNSAITNLQSKYKQFGNDVTLRYNAWPV